MTIRSFTALLTFFISSACGTHLQSALAPLSGRAVEVVETGSGSATVVFESGLGNDWAAWDQVASEVAGHARVFAYSRPGYGRSESSPDPRDAAHIVEDLRTLLASRNLAPPYILVGHSFGGGYMEYFAKAHPEEVVGLVMVDPRHRDFSTACQEAGVSGCDIPAAAVKSMRAVEQGEVAAYLGLSEEARPAIERRGCSRAAAACAPDERASSPDDESRIKQAFSSICAAEHAPFRTRARGGSVADRAP